MGRVVSGFLPPGQIAMKDLPPLMKSQEKENRRPAKGRPRRLRYLPFRISWFSACFPYGKEQEKPEAYDRK